MSAAASSSPRRRIPFRWFVLVPCMVAGGLIYMADRALFSRLVSIAGSAMMIFSVIVMIRTYNKAKTVRARSLFLGMGMGLASLFTYAVFMQIPFTGNIIFLALLFGMLIGTSRCLTTRLFWQEDTVKSRGSIGYLLLWAVVFSFNQIVTAFTGRPPRIAVLLMLMSTGMVLGNNFLMLFRSTGVRWHAARKLRKV